SAGCGRKSWTPCPAGPWTWPSMPRSRAARGSPKGVYAATADFCGSPPGNRQRGVRVPPGGLRKNGPLCVRAVVAPVPRRRGLGFAGMVSVALAVSGRGELICDPHVRLTGIPEADALGHSIEDIAYDAAVEAFESMPRARRRDPEAVAEALRQAVRAALAAA